MKTRLKMHQMPGDVPSQEKAALLEGRHPTMDRKGCKAYKRMILARERTVLRERTKREVASQLDAAN